MHVIFIPVAPPRGLRPRLATLAQSRLADLLHGPRDPGVETLASDIALGQTMP